MKKLLTILMAFVSFFSLFYFSFNDITYADYNIEEMDNYSNNFWTSSNLNDYFDSYSKERMLPSPKISYTLATVFTPKKTSVEVMRITEWERYNATDINNDYDNRYPGATRLATATFRYNCHSYAWHSVSTTYNNYWMNDPSSYYRDGSFYESTAKVGNIICYYNSAGKNLHSGVIIGIDNTKTGVSAITVNSKWGAAGLYRHSADYCPYYDDNINIKYYEHVAHTYSNHYEYKDSTYHKCYCSCGSYILGRHYAASTNSIEDYEAQSSEEMNSVIGKPFSVCALCNGVLDPDKYYPVIGFNEYNNYGVNYEEI